MIYTVVVGGIFLGGVALWINMWIQVLFHGDKERPIRQVRTPSQGKPESILEEQFRELLRSHGFTEPVLQHWIRVGDAALPANYRIDFAYPRQRLAIETDGREWHEGFEARDQRRDERLCTLGWRTLRFNWDEVVLHPEVAVSRLKEAGVPYEPWLTWSAPDR